MRDAAIISAFPHPQPRFLHRPRHQALAAVKTAARRANWGVIQLVPVLIARNPRQYCHRNQPCQADERMMAMETSMARDLLRDVKARKVGDAAKNSKVGFFVWQMMSGDKRHYYCGVGRGMAAITTSGDIYPCHRFAGQEDMKLGHIDSYRVDGINDYHRAAVDNLSECKHCWARYACGGGCFYESKAARGDIRLPDRSRCQETKALMEMAIPLYLQLDDADKAYVKDSLKRQLEDQIP